MGPGGLELPTSRISDVHSNLRIPANCWDFRGLGRGWRVSGSEGVGVWLGL